MPRREEHEFARTSRARARVVATAVAVFALLLVATAPAEAAPPAPAFNPVTYNWNSVGHRKPARRIVRFDLELKGDNTTAAGLNTAVSKSTVIVNGGYNTRVTDSILGGMFRVYVSKLSHVRGVIEHSTVMASTGRGATGVTGSSFVAQFNDITAINDGITPTGEGSHQSVIQYNKIHRDGSVLGSAHHDGIQFWQNGNAVIRRNWISGWQTSAILIKSDLTPISHITITENYLANPTGYFAVYVRDGGHGRPRYIDITNNAFGPRATPISSGSNKATEATFVRTAARRQAAIDAGNASAAEWIVWSGNYYASGPKKGKEIAPPGRWLS
jgi:hypothetical protein